MSNMSQLPYGADRIEVQDVLVVFLNNMMFLAPKGDINHISICMKNQSGIVDVHRTCRRPNHTAEHETLFAIRHDDIPQVTNELLPRFRSFSLRLLESLRPLRMGWMSHNRIGVVKDLEAFDQDDLANVTSPFKKRGKTRLVIDAKKLANRCIIPEYLEEVLDFADGPFSLFSTRLDRHRRVGFGFKVTGADNQVRLYWIKRSDLTRVFASLESILLDTLLKYVIPPECYKDYPELSRRLN